MKLADKILQKMRLRAVAPYIKEMDYILDVGTGDGAFFRYFDKVSGVGIDPDPKGGNINKRVTIITDIFPSYELKNRNFDAIVMLAVLEHIPEKKLNAISENCRSFLKMNGLVLITVPSKKVDFILKVLKKIKIVDAETLHQHYGFDVKKVDQLFNSSHFKLLVKRKFQLGLNNLFVFKKIS